MSMINIIELGDGSVVSPGDPVAYFGTRRAIGHVHSIGEGRPAQPWSDREIVVRMEFGTENFCSFFPPHLQLARQG